MYCPNCGSKNEDDYEFCMSCGANLKVRVNNPPQPEGPTPPPAQQPTLAQQMAAAAQMQQLAAAHQPAPAQPGSVPPTPAPQARKKGLKIRLNKKTAIILGVVAGLFVLLALAAGAALLLGPTLVTSLSGGEPLYFTVQEQGAGSPVVAINSIRPNQKSAEEVYSDPDGFRLAESAFDIMNGGYAYLSPNGKVVALTGEKDKSIILVPLAGGEPTTIEISSDRSTFMPIGFAPDGQLFAYSAYDYTGKETKISTSLVDLQGNEVFNVPDALYGRFLKNNHQMLMLMAHYKNGSSDNTADLAMLDLETGEVAAPLANLDYTKNSNAAGVLFENNAGGGFYYADAEGLSTISAQGGSPRQVLDSKGLPIGFETKNGYLVVLDADTSSSTTTADLYAMNLKTNKKTRIDKFVALQQTSYDSYSHYFVQVSPDGRSLAYITTDTNGSQELNVAKITGEGVTRLAHGGSKYRFAFSTDGKRLVYIEYNNTNDAGTLYTIDLSGQKRVKLDDSAWSFRLVGSQVIYSRVEDLSRGRPTSDIIKIGLDGKNKQPLMQAQDGLFTFLPAGR